MSCRQIVNRQEWNNALLSIPVRHVLQSWEWGELKGRYGWVPTRLLWERAGQPVAAALVLRRSLTSTPWSVMYVPKGPLLDYGDALCSARTGHSTRVHLFDRVLEDLESYSRSQRAIFVKIDPDADLCEADVEPLARVHPVVQALVARGWLFSAQQIQFRNTALLDLSPSKDDLLTGMKSKTRYNTRLARRRGVTVRIGTVQDIPCFYEMYSETAKRDRFLIRPFEYYRDTWQTLLEAELALMLLAEVRDTMHKADTPHTADASVRLRPPPPASEAIAGLILCRFGDRAWFMYGASTAKHRNRMPNYALQWEAIRWAKSVGCATYDLWGAPDTLDESDRLWGVWRFKEGLGARFTPHIGAYDYPTSRLLYWAYGIALPRYLDRLRRRM